MVRRYTKSLGPTTMSERGGRDNNKYPVSCLEKNVNTITHYTISLNPGRNPLGIHENPRNL